MMSKLSEKRLLFVEELANSLTHGLGLLLSVAALTLLVVFASLYGTAWHIVSFSIYGATLIILYLASTLYHSSRKLRRRYKLNKFDHSAIYVLIAGTYTPFALVPLRGPVGWTLFAVVWVMAIGGVIYKVFFYSQRYRTLSAVLYLVMGSLVVLVINPLMRTMPLNGLYFLLAGEISYALGVVFYLWRFPFGHTIFHLFVLGGSICHFFSVFLYLY